MLLLDCGGFFSIRFARSAEENMARIGLKAANVMDYTAMNIGAEELAFGMDFLGKQSTDLSFPLLSSNFIYLDESMPHLTKQYVMAQVDNLTVAVLGVMPQQTDDMMSRPGISGTVKVIPPAEALASLLPEVQKRADIVILLSHLGSAETTRLVSTLDGIDLTICGGEDNDPSGCKEEMEQESRGATPILHARFRGSHLGYVRLSLDDAGRVSVDNAHMIYLNDAVASDDTVLGITGIDAFARAAEEKQRKMEREIKELHKLSPEEYLKKLAQEKSQ